MNLTYLPAEKEDILPIFRQAKQLIDSYEDLTSIDYDKVMAWMERKITDSIGEYTCVWQDGQKAAYYHLCEDGELDDVYVLPQYRGKGIGSAIVRRCIDQSEAPLYLYVFSRNTDAIRLYARFGFEKDQTVSKTRLILRRNG